MVMQALNTLGGRLRSRRLDRNILQSQVAEQIRVGKTPPAIAGQHEPRWHLRVTCARHMDFKRVQ